MIKKEKPYFLFNKKNKRYIKKNINLKIVLKPIYLYQMKKTFNFLCNNKKLK